MAETNKTFDLGEHLSGHLKSEIEGFNGYMDMAEIADKKGDSELCEYLMQMAEDEYTHAYFIYKYMEEHCCTITSECREKYDCMCSRRMRFFQ